MSLLTRSLRLLIAETLTLALVTVTPAAPLKPGDRAPSLDLEVVLQGPEAEEVTWASLTGKAVVLEFWATWCAPCIGAIPHWNELTQEMEGEPVQFLSITDEGAEVIRPYLERRPIDGWIGLDTDRSVFEAFGVEGIPHTVLVDGDGIVRAVTDPFAVTAEALRKLAAGQDPGVRPRQEASEVLASLRTALAGGSEKGAEPLLRVVVRPSRSPFIAAQIGPGFILQMGFFAGGLVQNAFQVSSSRIVFERELPEGAFDVLVEVGPDDLRYPLLHQALEAAFEIQLQPEEREMDVYRLVRTGGSAPGLDAAQGEAFSSRGGRGSYTATAVTGARLARWLEGRVGRPVVDASGLEGHFDVELSWDSEASGGFERILAEQLGLALEESRATVEVLVVR